MAKQNSTLLFINLTTCKDNFCCNYSVCITEVHRAANVAGINYENRTQPIITNLHQCSVLIVSHQSEATPCSSRHLHTHSVFVACLVHLYILSSVTSCSSLLSRYHSYQKQEISSFTYILTPAPNWKIARATVPQVKLWAPTQIGATKERKGN